MVSPLATMPSRGSGNGKGNGNSGSMMDATTTHGNDAGSNGSRPPTGAGIGASDQAQQGDQQQQQTFAYHEHAGYRIQGSPYSRHESGHGHRQTDSTGQASCTFIGDTVMSSSQQDVSASNDDGVLPPPSPVSERETQRTGSQGNATASNFYTHGSYNVQPHHFGSHYTDVPLFRPRLVEDVKPDVVKSASDGTTYQDYYATVRLDQTAQQQTPSQQQQGHAYSHHEQEQTALAASQQEQQQQQSQQQRLYHSQAGMYGHTAHKAHQHVDTEAFASVGHAAAANLALAASKPIARKGRWSAAEDHRLRESVAIHGPSNWKQVAKDVGTRTGDQCWKRWNDALRPDLRHGTFTAAEDEILETAVHDTHGRSWSKIAKELLHGRCGLACKNRFDHIERKRRRKQVSMKHAASASMSALDGSMHGHGHGGGGNASGHADDAAMRRMGYKTMHGYHSTRGVRHHRSRSSLEQAMQQNMSASPTSTVESPSYSSSLALDGSDGGAIRYYGRHSDGSTSLTQTRTFLTSEPHFSGGTFSTSSFNNFRWPQPVMSSSHHQHGSSSASDDAVGSGSGSTSYPSHARSGVTTLLGGRQYFGSAHPYGHALASRQQQFRLLGSSASLSQWHNAGSSSSASNPFGSHTVSSVHNSVALQPPGTLFASPEMSTASSPTDARSSPTNVIQGMKQDYAGDESPTAQYGDQTSSSTELQQANDMPAYYPHQQYPDQASQPQPAAIDGQSTQSTFAQDLQTRASASSISSMSVSQSTASASLVTPVDVNGSQSSANGVDALFQRDANQSLTSISTTSPVAQQTPNKTAASPPFPMYMSSAGRTSANMYERPSTTMSWHSRQQTADDHDTTPHASQRFSLVPLTTTPSVAERHQAADIKPMEECDMQYPLQTGLLFPAAYQRGHNGHGSTDVPDKQVSYALPQSASPLEERVNDSGLAVSSASMHVPFDGGGSQGASGHGKYDWPHDSSASHLSRQDSYAVAGKYADEVRSSDDRDAACQQREAYAPDNEQRTHFATDDTVQAVPMHNDHVGPAGEGDLGHNQRYHHASIAALVAEDVVAQRRKEEEEKAQRESGAGGHSKSNSREEAPGYATATLFEQAASSEQGEHHPHLKVED